MRSVRLTRNDLVPEPARSRADLAIQDAGATGSRDRPAAASVECAASRDAGKAEADGGRSTALRQALSAVPIGIERTWDCPARDCHPVASGGIPAVLALEVALSWRPTTDTRGDPPPDPGDELGKSALGSTAHPRRTAQARNRSCAVDGRQIHGEEWARAVADLEDLSPQSHGWRRCHGLPDRADGGLPIAL